MRKQNSQKPEGREKRFDNRNKKGSFPKDERKDLSKDKDETNTYIPYKSRHNDPRWYAANEQILRDVASYPYQWPLGNTINYGVSGADANNWALPGVMAIQVAPTPGYCDDPNDPVNVAARNAFSYIRHANSGSANYDSPDLMLYFLAMDSAYMMISYLKRIYGVMLDTSQTNKYYAKAVVQSMGVDYDDIRVNLADFRAMINTYVVKVGSMCVPATMSYMAKHIWMFEGLYLDQNIDKAQTYMFVPHGYYTYTLDSDGAGMLQWNNFNTNPGVNTMATLRTIMDSILDPILSGVGVQDFNIMSGDILKAYGAGNVIKVDTIPENYAILPTCDETVLDQIQNLTLMGALLPTSNTILGGNIQDIHQDATKSYLVYTPKFYNAVPFSGNPIRPNTVTVVAGDNCFTTNRIITFEHGDITPAETMEATRMANIASKVEYVPGYYAQLITCDTLGSEVATRAAIYRYEVQNNVLVLASKRNFDQSWTFINIISDTSTETVATAANGIKTMYDRMNQLMTLLSYFRRHMPVAVTAGIVDEATGTWSFDSFNGYFFDVNYYTVIDRDDLKMMSEAALMSEFAVTQFGRAAAK